MFDIAGDSNRPGVNTLIVQPIINYNLAKGWAITVGSMSWVANLKAPSGEKWDVPIGAGIAKIFAVGKHHVKAQVVAYSHIWHPTGAPDTSLQAQFTFLFPK